MNRPPDPATERSRAIDILRALAIVFVLGRHMDACPAETSRLLSKVTHLWERGGWVGVDLFFVLSGFLVSGLLFREHARHGRISLKSYFIRRGFKIYPAFWLMTVTTVVVLVASGQPFKRLAVPCEFLFLQNYGPALWGHTWSLAVEEHFYFFLVLLLLGLSARPPSPKPFRVLPVVFVAIAVTCLALRLAAWAALPRFVDKLSLYPTHLRMDSLFAGVLASYYYHAHHEALMAGARRWRWGLLAAGLALFVPAFLLPLSTTPFIHTFGLTLLYLGGVALLLALLALRPPANFLTSALAYVGSHSYSIYLWHVPLTVWLVPELAGGGRAGGFWFLYFTVYFLGSIGVGILLANLIEFPLLRLRDRWCPSRAR
jgi:peptidoglycan/LPS O-acetylase OafA/YrhL